MTDEQWEKQIAEGQAKQEAHIAKYLPKVDTFFATVDTTLFDTTKRSTTIYNLASYTHNLELVSENIRIIFSVSVDDQGALMVDGETLYRANDTWYTFSRRGIEDSFYSPWGKCASDWCADETILEQIERAEKRIVKAIGNGPTQIVFGSITVSETGIKKHLAEFAAKGTTFFSPAGMGIARKITKTFQQWSHPLRDCDRKILGIVGPAWVTDVDWD